MQRPKLKLDLDTWDWILEIAAGFFLILMMALPSYYFSDLPDFIPKHFNATGEPDGFGQKSMIWIMPAIGLIMYIGMFFLNRYPHLFNYPTEVSSKNARQQYRFATKLIRGLNTVIMAGFCFIVYSTIKTALNEQSGLGTLFLPIFFLGIFGAIGLYLYNALRKKA